MRLTLAFAVLMAGAGPGWTVTMTDDEVLAISCRAYVAGSSGVINGTVQNAIVSRLSDASNASRLGSECNMAEYAVAECRLHRNDDLAHALERLESAGAAGWLPIIPKCGS